MLRALPPPLCHCCPLKHFTQAVPLCYSGFPSSGRGPLMDSTPHNQVIEICPSQPLLKYQFIFFIAVICCCITHCHKTRGLKTHEFVDQGYGLSLVICFWCRTSWMSGTGGFPSKTAPALTCLVLGLEGPAVAPRYVRLKLGLQTRALAQGLSIRRGHLILWRLDPQQKQPKIKCSKAEAAMLLSSQSQKSQTIISTTFCWSTRPLSSAQIQEERTNFTCQ